MLAYNAFYGEGALLSTCSRMARNRNRKKLWWHGMPCHFDRAILVVIVTKQVTHHFDVVIASMVQARQPESRLE
jgi:hypothetical protein